MTITTPKPSLSTAKYCPGLHIVAVLTACMVFPLIFVGAGVTSKGAGMAYPDWPTSAGHIVNPPAWWQADDTRWEHGHRLIGWVVGMLAITSAGLAWPRGRAIRLMALATLGAIVVQGVLGGLRVREVSTLLAMLHGIWGQLCFCLACVTALMATPTWRRVKELPPLQAGMFLRRLCVVATVGVFVQLILGAAQRHFDSQDALLAHIFWAIVVSCLLGWVAMWVMGQGAGKNLLSRLGRVIAILMAVQLLLGGFTFVVTTLQGTWSPLIGWLVPSAHAAVGALVLAAMVLLTVLVRRTARADGASCEAIGSASLVTA